jgi:hypothetical protein
MLLRYVGPHDEVETADGAIRCKRDATVEVSPHIAGRAPAGDDPGEGLLAQPSNWVAAKAAPKAPPVPAGDQDGDA